MQARKPAKFRIVSAKQNSAHGAGLKIATANIKNAAICRSDQNFDPLRAQIVDKAMLLALFGVEDVAHFLGEGGTLEDGVGLGEAEESKVV